MSHARSGTKRPRRCGGFTLVELVSVLIILSILALVALPRFFNRDSFDARVFHDQSLSMFRYAQKIAIAQNRNVHVRLDGSSFAFCFDAFGAGGTCANIVPAPSGSNSGSAQTLAACGNSNAWLCEAIPDHSVYAATPPAVTGFYFNSLGKPFAPGDVSPDSTFVKISISLDGDGIVRSIVIEPETGYVHA